MTTKPYVPYQAEEPWLPFSEALLSWDEAFHHLMLNDHIRMIAYKAAIDEVIKPGDTVLDLGTGTGILGLWALEAGAGKVYGIDMDPEVLAIATSVMAQNGFEDRFVPINKLSFDVDLPERVDVLISEIMGNMGDNEGFQPILNDAIERMLKPGGKCIPLEVESHIVPVAACGAHEAVSKGDVATINDSYSLDPLLESHGVNSRFDMYYDAILPRATYLGSPALLKRYQDDWIQSSAYTEARTFDINTDGLLTGFKVYFVACLSPKRVLDISGDDILGRTTSDSWKHAYLPIAEPISVKCGDRLSLEFSRFYPIKEEGVTDRFRQGYEWQGSVKRHGDLVAMFRQATGARVLVGTAANATVHEE
ncbi:50S ribosomal protein L11 methyltransferase [Marinimicrobium sp. C2-29]|uniref:50S ribosomal protein L11 methyltransferase n=1 Tax=Marinimicrobium sp. C2-29 TaxID=3139825 RepID=UPI003138DE7D